MPDFERQRLGMVDTQIRVADVTDQRILSAFLAVPRERFVPEARRDLAYLDSRVPLGGAGRAMLEPMTLARLIQLAAPVADERALVVGCALGYTVGLLAELRLEAVGLEVDPALAAGARDRLAGVSGATVVEGPLPEGAPGHAPFDLIFCDGAVAGELDRLGGQLAPHGRMVAPAGAGRATKATVFRLHGGRLAGAATFDACGPLLPGFEPREAFAF